MPHFDLPFRHIGGHAAEVQQDTLDDIRNCVEAIVITYVGDRLEIPDFGIFDPTFQNQPVQTQALISAILKQEPRASILMEQAPDEFDQLIARITLHVSAKDVSAG